MSVIQYFDYDIMISSNKKKKKEDYDIMKE